MRTRKDPRVAGSRSKCGARAIVAEGDHIMEAGAESPTTGPGESLQKFRRRFPNRPRVFLPVIYAATEKQVMINVEIAQETGADGVFLINHGIDYQRLLQISEKVAAAYPSLFVGVNCLDLAPEEVIRRLPEEVKGVWANELPPAKDRERAKLTIHEAQQLTGWNGIFFAAIGRSRVENAGEGMPQVSPIPSYVDVPTMVGHASEERDIGFFKKLRRALGAQPLGIAASISSDAVDALLPFADCVMTTARRGSRLEQMDAQEARRLAEKTHAES